MGLAVSGEFQRFRDALALQGRVVWALVLREMRTRFGHSRLGYAWALGEPVVFILVLSALKSAAGGGVSALGTSIPVFFFTGIVPFLMFRRTTQQLGSAISANRALLNYPPVRPVDTLIARALLEIATMLVVALLIGSVFAGLGLPIMPDDPLRFLGALSAAALLGIGFGTFNAAVSGVMKWWPTVVTWMLTASLFITGVFFVIDFMPPSIREALAWIPLTHAIALARSAHYPGYESEVVDVGFLVISGLVLLAVGLLAERALRRRSEE